MRHEIYDIDYHRQKLANTGGFEELIKTYSGVYPELEISTPEKWDDLSSMDFVPKIRLQRLERVAKLIPPNSRILDIGVGWGDIITILEAKHGNIDYTGIDFSPKVVGKLADKYPAHKFICTTVDTIKEKYDVILVLEVLEHMLPTKVLDFLRCINNILNEDGKLIVDVPINEDLKNNTFICGNCGKLVNKMGHIRIYSAELIKAELALTGYSVNYTELLYLGYHGVSGFFKRKARDYLGKTIGPMGIKKVEPGCIILECKKK